MTFSSTQQQHLLTALRHLSQENTRDFEGVMWLEFGDDWLSVVQRLVKRGIILFGGWGTGEASLTSKGLAFLAALMRHREARTSPESLAVSL